MYLTTELMLFISINVKTRHSRRFALQSMYVSVGTCAVYRTCVHQQQMFQLTTRASSHTETSSRNVLFCLNASSTAIISQMLKSMVLASLLSRCFS